MAGDVDARSASRTELMATKYASIVLLLIATLALFSYLPRYEPVAGELLDNATFAQGLKHWRTYGGTGATATPSGQLVLNNDDGSRALGVHQSVTPPFGSNLLMLSADISIEQVQSGAKPWHRARLYLGQRLADAEVPADATHTVLFGGAGNIAWAPYSAPIRIDDETAKVFVVAQLLNATGTMRIRNLRLVPVIERSDFQILAWVLLGAWALAAIWIARGFLRNTETAFGRVSFCVVAVAITVGVLMPGAIKDVLYQFGNGGGDGIRSMLAWAAGIAGIEIDDASIAPDKFAHFVLFGVLAAAVTMTNTIEGRVNQIIWLLMFAATTETLQLFAIDRHPRVQDWLIDVAGIALALALFWMYQSAHRAIVRRGSPGLPPSTGQDAG